MDDSDKTDRIKLMEQFSADIMNHFNNSTKLSQTDRDDIRRRVNENNRTVRRYVLEAGCLKTLTIGPPPAVGGLVMKNVDPFDSVFQPLYGQSVIPTIRDMIEQAIGVMKDADFGHSLPEGISPESASIRKGYAFVAMSMDPRDKDLDDVLDAIKEACERCDVIAERIDDQSSNDPITDRMLESIRLAEFVVVDLTHEKPNVYYEAGYAQGFGKTPIYLARTGTALHFDLKDYPVIFFENLRGLKDQLEARMRAIASS